MAAHLEREESHGLLEIDGHVACHREGAGRLTHGGTGGEDNQCARLEARRHAVEPYEAALQAAQSVLLLPRLVDLVHGHTHKVAQRLVVAAEVLVVDVHQPGLGLVEQVDHVGGLVVGLLDGLGADAYHLALYELLAEHADVVLYVCRRHHVLGQFRHCIGTAGGLELAVQTQALDHRQHVDRLTLLEKLADGAVHCLMLRLVEVFHMQYLYGVDQGGLVQHQGSEHTLLERHSLRRRVAVEGKRLVVGHSVSASCIGKGHFSRANFGLQRYILFPKRRSFFFQHPTAAPSPTPRRPFPSAPGPVVVLSLYYCCTILLKT